MERKASLDSDPVAGGIVAEVRREKALLKAGALQNAIFNSANFSSIATDEKGVIQIFNVGAERMLGYTAAEVLNKITPAQISDPQEVIARAKALSQELETAIAPGFEALVFKASRGIEDVYELTYIRKDGSRFPAVVSVTALRDVQGGIIGYLLIGTDNTARKRAEEALLKAGALQNAIFNSANFSSIATDDKGVIQIFNVGAERMLGYTAAEVLNKITPAEISDPQEVISRAKALSQELETTIAPGFEALVFKASRGIEDVYELTYIRKDGSRFPAVVSVTALRDIQGGIIGYLLIGTDNTARKHAEEALLKAGALQNAIFNSANFSSIATDDKGVIQIFNVGAERMLGYTAAEVLNKITPAEISDPQEVIARAKALSQELETTIAPGFEALVFKASRGIEDVYELTYIRKDGSRFPAVVSVTALRDGQGGIIGYLLIGTDNTARKQVEAERKQADEELQRANAKLKAWAQALDSFAIVAETDTQGRITYANDPFCSISKYSRKELLGQDHRDVVNSGYHSKEFWKEMWSTISRGQSWRGEIKNCAKDGTVYWVDTVIVPLLGTNGKPETYLAIRFVTTERKMAEELLRTSSAYVRSLIEASLDPLVTISSEGKITDVNEASVQATGVRREQLIATDFSDYFTEPDKARAGYQKVFSEGYVRDYPLAIRHITSRITDVLYNASVYKDDKGKVLGVFAVARDVTERKRFEQALQETNVKLESAKSAAEKANLAKSDFLSSMSHELRTPLNAILGFAQLMASASPVPTAAQAARIAQILQAGWYLLNLINEILDLTVIESGTVPLSKEAVSLPELISECQAMMEPQAQQRGIRMTFPTFDNPIFVMADRIRLKQILINLVSNAIKYNKAQGTVVVECTGSSPERMRFSVKDTGDGLSPEKVAQLFQPFNRLGQEAGSVAGTGIGLVVSKRLAELMGGVMGVESTVGVGSVFWCELISAAAPQLAVQSGDAKALAHPQAPTDAPLRTLLYVEDNPANMMLVEQLIAECPDIRLLTAVNGTLGIELARATQPTVILMDINLPGISGIKALKILHEDPATAHIPVVALSANAMPRDIQKGLEAGFFRYLTKPIRVN